MVEDDRIVEVGPGLDGDHAVEYRSRGVLPGLFDCHVHMTSSSLGTLERLEAPFSLQFYEAAENMRRTLAAGSPPCVTPSARILASGWRKSAA